MKKFKTSLIVALELVVTTLLLAQPALAATTSKTTPAKTVPATSNTISANGYLVKPISNNLTVSPGTKQTQKLFVQNISKGNEDIQAIVNDFEAGTDEEGTPALLLNGDQAPRHGLKQYVTLSTSRFTLKPGDTKEVDVTIAIPVKAAGGGYYGVVRFAPANANGSQNVNLAASVGALFLVRVPGDVKELLTVASFDVRKGEHPRVVFINGHDLTALVRFQNAGNVQVTPFGKMVLKQGNKILESDEINLTDPKSQVLPDSIRRYAVSLKKVGSFGKYTVQGNFGYGTNGQLLTASTTFYIVPVSALILAALVVLLLLFVIFVLPRMIRAYNRRVIQRATRRR